MRITWKMGATNPAVTANEIVIRTCCENYLLLSFSTMYLRLLTKHRGSFNRHKHNCAYYIYQIQLRSLCRKKIDELANTLCYFYL